ncbi:S-layer homology domain-containing protein [Xylanibacillus composti]|nr:S-layer homology domain-containing protein [Xylanibacillus composti]
MKTVIVRRTVLVLLAFSLMMGGSVFAFSDLPQGESRQKLEELKRMGIISGTGDGRFQPDGELTNAQAIAMLIKGFDLSWARVQFEQGKEVSYDNVAADAWYAESFELAAHYGFELPSDIDPNAVISKAAYVHYLHRALELQGPFPVTKMYFMIEDEDDIEEAYKNSIQIMLNARLISLDEKQHFYPTQPITRLEAAVLLYDSLSLVRERQEFEDSLQQPEEGEEPTLPIVQEPVEEKPLSIEDDASHTIVPVNEEVNKVIVDWGTKPHPGYGIAIAGIVFEGDKAIIQYDRLYPDPDSMYPQVIAYPKAETFVSSAYTIELEEVNTED